MKTLFISALVAALSITGHYRHAHAQELCVNGKLSKLTTIAKGPNVLVTNCQWEGTNSLNLDANTAKSIVVSGGTTLGSIAFYFRTPVNPTTVVFSNNFSTIFLVSFSGHLQAGSSITITDCMFESRTSSSFDFTALDLTGTRFDFSRNLLTLNANDKGISMPQCRAGCAYTVDDNVFNFTKANTYAAITAPTSYNSTTFVSRRNLFSCSQSVTATSGYSIVPSSIVSTLAPETLPSNWSLVTDEDARNLYGKSTYVIADNLFKSVTNPWLIIDKDGADFTIENNTAIKTTSVTPAYTYSGNHYRFVLTIRNTTLTNTANANAYFSMSVKTLPAHSSVLIQNNTLTTGGTNPCIVRLQSATIYNASALFEISDNVLLSSTGLTGVQGGVYAIYSGYSA